MDIVHKNPVIQIFISVVNIFRIKFSVILSLDGVTIDGVLDW
jgi:hypothetical protein